MSTQQDYVIIRDIGRGAFRDPFSPGMLESLGPASGAELSVEVEPLRLRDVAALNRDPQVVGAAPSMPVQVIRPTASEEADVASEDAATWGIRAVGAHDTPYTGAGVTVAILDTGIDAGHPAFAGVDVVQKDFTGEGVGDGNGHGTHCAGTVFGQAVGDTRFGVAPGIDKALIGKVLGGEGGGSTRSIYDGLLWASDQGANIVSMSLGFDFPGLVERLVQTYDLEIPQATTMALEGYRTNVALFEKLAALLRVQSGLVGPGVVVIAAAGNESRRDAAKPYEIAVAPPAAADGIVSVGALASHGAPDRDLTIASFSNTGPNVSGPGVQIFSAWPGGGFRNLSGTSMATPHVAGVAALWAQKLLEETGSIRPEQLKARLIGQAQRRSLAADVDMTDIGVGLVHCPVA